MPSKSTLTLLSPILLVLSACPGGPAECQDGNEDCGPGTCDGDDGDEMLPGSPCIACHSPGNLDDDRAPARDEDEHFTVAGTVFVSANGGAGVSGVTVEVSDADGEVIQMTTNEAGNFWSDRQVTPPLLAELVVDGERTAMRGDFDSGDCNDCHACDGEAGEKIYAEER